MAITFYDVAHAVTGNLYRLMFGVSVKGRENIPETGGAILCSNHTSYYDPIALAILTCRRKVNFMAKKELFENPKFSRLISSLGAFPVDREGNDLKAIKTALKILKDGGVLGIFPEGTRTPEMDLSKAKSGVVMFAIKAKVPIIPVYIESDYKLLKPLRITIREPIYYDEYYGKKVSAEEYSELAKDVLRKIYGAEKSDSDEEDLEESEIQEDKENSEKK